MANRTLPSTSPLTGTDWMNAVIEKTGLLFDAICLVPTNITNTGNDYTITIDPVLDTGTDVQANMRFLIQPNVTNTGTVRMRVTSSNPYYNVLDFAGNAIEAGDFDTNAYYFVAFVGGAFRILSQLGAGVQISSVVSEVFDSSGTWNKPANVSPNATVLVELWGGGGGGGTAISAASNRGGGGGGGGSYARAIFTLSDLGSSESVVVGNGGPAGALNVGGLSSPGGNTSFNGIVAYGGGAGFGPNGANNSSGGAGAGELEVGGDGQVSASSVGGRIGGGDCALNADGDDASTIYGGAAGASSTNSSSARNGGWSVFGGAGGAAGRYNSGGNPGVGGTSKHGGDGGDGGDTIDGNGRAGTAPGGGGGGSEGGAGNVGGPGANGRVIIHIFQ